MYIKKYADLHMFLEQQYSALKLEKKVWKVKIQNNLGAIKTKERTPTSYNQNKTNVD